MKKSIALGAAIFLIAGPLFFSCNDEAPYYGEGIYSDFNGYYSNKTLKDPAAGVLELSYSEVELSGKEVWFELMTKNTARLKFSRVFPGEVQTIINDVRVQKVSEGYILEGKYVTGENTSFVLSGTVGRSDKSRVMNLKLTDVEIPTNKLSGKTFKTFETSEDSYADLVENEFIYYISYEYNTIFKWIITNDDGTEENLLDLPFFGFGVSAVLEPIISNLLFLAIDEFNFHKDGNITSTYCRFESLDFTKLMAGATEADRGPAELSPKNLITYFVKNDSLVYIRPELSAIIDLIKSNSNGPGSEEGVADGSSGINIEIGIGDINFISLLNLINSVSAIYPEFGAIFSDGMPFRLEEIDPNGVQGEYYGMQAFFKNRGNYRLSLDSELLIQMGKESVVKGIINLLTGLWDILEVNIDDIEIPADTPVLGGMVINVNELANELFERMARTKSIQMGLYLETK